MHTTTQAQDRTSTATKSTEPLPPTTHINPRCPLISTSSPASPQNHQHQHHSPHTPNYHTSPYPLEPPTFPLEIWAQILTHLPTLPLLHTMRLVSRTLYSEATRVFRTTRLSSLHMRWCITLRTVSVHGPTSIELYTRDVKRVSDNGRFVTYALGCKVHAWTEGMEEWAQRMFEEGRLGEVEGGVMREGILRGLGVLGGGGGGEEGDSGVVKTKVWFEDEVDGGECYEGVGEVVWRTVDLEKKEIDVEWERMVRELVGERRVVVEVY